MYEIANFQATYSWPQPPTTPVEIRAGVADLAEALKPYPQEELPVQHEFLDGIYMRTVMMRAGLVVVGKIHKQEHVAIISKGRASVVTENGVVEMAAPFMFKSPPGVQRALIIHEDMIWTTVHRSEHRDLDKLEEQLIAKDFNDPVLTKLEQQARAIQCRGV